MVSFQEWRVDSFGMEQSEIKEGRVRIAKPGM